MDEQEPPARAPETPSALWQIASSATIGSAGTLCKAFLSGLNKLEVHGLDGFTRLLDERRDIHGRQRGLITVSNHLSVLDDPLIWGVLPMRHLWSPNDMRWSLGSHDIAFKGQLLSNFFSLGQVLPTHRLAYSPMDGGPFQSTMTQAIRLLSRRPYAASVQPDYPSAPQPTLIQRLFASSSPQLPTKHDIEDAFTRSAELSDPFTVSQLTYTTTGHDTFRAPSAYLSRRHAWVHIFPEGRIHQHPSQHMRYFKWGVARLILESEPCPDLVPMWIEGVDKVMPEDRGFPRPLPRVGKHVSVTFGDRVDMAASGFEELRRQWREMVAHEKQRDVSARACELGECPVALEERPDAVKLRELVTMKVRDEVIKLRISRGWPEEDPKARLVDTWREEGRPQKREGRMSDGSIVKERSL